MWPDWSRVRSLGTLHPALESALQKTWHGDKHEAEEARVPVARSCVRVRAQIRKGPPMLLSRRLQDTLRYKFGNIKNCWLSSIRLTRMLRSEVPQRQTIWCNGGSSVAARCFSDSNGCFVDPSCSCSSNRFMNLESYQKHQALVPVDTFESYRTLTFTACANNSRLKPRNALLSAYNCIHFRKQDGVSSVDRKLSECGCLWTARTSFKGSPSLMVRTTLISSSPKMSRTVRACSCVGLHE
ncbi:hypothetical protein GQ600_19340 [Phytophthora cactorum]|nr:hypothetical protein GQ600_19340 [Phytophthora cactorum]